MFVSGVARKAACDTGHLVTTQNREPQLNVFIMTRDIV